MKFITATILIILFGFTDLFAQEVYQYQWGDSPLRSRENYYLMKKKLEENQIQEAKKACEWLLKNTPQLHPNLYYYGIKVFEQYNLTLKDSLQHVLTQDSLILICDLYAKNFEKDEKKALEYKAAFVIKFWHKRKEKFIEMFELYTKIFTSFQKDVDGVFIKNYMAIATSVFKKKYINDIKLKQIYLALKEISTQKMIENKETWTTVLAFLDKNIKVLEVK